MTVKNLIKYLNECGECDYKKGYDYEVRFKGQDEINIVEILDIHNSLSIVNLE